MLTLNAEHWPSERIETKNTHGTGGCLHLFANKARGASEIEATHLAKGYIKNAIAEAGACKLGRVMDLCMLFVKIFLVQQGIRCPIFILTWRVYDNRSFFSDYV